MFNLHFFVCYLLCFHLKGSKLNDLEISDYLLDDEMIRADKKPDTVEIYDTDTDSDVDDQADDREEGEFIPDSEWNELLQLPYDFPQDFLDPLDAEPEPELTVEEQREKNRQDFLRQREYMPDASTTMTFQVFAQVNPDSKP